ncbi:uncharacterized protein LOC106769554 [Vigna radiata var. radiata]|uniref:Uncharacterized protein LOC106769554 n=1 Tax=Vigna radiata var. radiata TaxID=3916 RepID=A0A1S3UXC8_VIGRR|nr:uncharacterized protein LOC106769554 [Vigna radiata var. radiata]
MLPFNQATLTPKPLNPTPSPNHHQSPPHPPPPPPSSSSSTAPTMTNTNPILDSNPPNLEGDSDSDIDALINAFFEPNPQFHSLDHLQGSTSDAKESSLKRGLDTGGDSSHAPILLKRGRIDNVIFPRADLHAAFQIQNPTPSPFPLSQPLPHAAATNGDTQVVEGQGRRPVFDSDFLSRALREAESVFPQNSGDNDVNFDVEPGDFSAPYLSLNDFRRIRNMERFRQIAKESATHYARFTSEETADERPSSSAAPQGIEDSTSPFSISMKAIKEGAAKKKGRETWVAKSQKGEKRVCVPSLQELCLKILADNADAMVSLEGVPDELRHKLCKLLCDSRKMNSHFLELLLSGSPTEIRLRDCSWLTVEQFAECFRSCDTGRLEVLQLDQCGRCIPDYALFGPLRQSPWWLPRLVNLSLSGACRLSDKGLHVLVSSAPSLRSINLSQCSLLSSVSVNILAHSLGSLLKELYLDDCLTIDAAQIVPALKKLEHLEVLSMAGIQTVSDEFIGDYITARGHNMKELVLKDCRKLTNASIKVIAEHCPKLCALDLMYLDNLTDLSMGYLTNNCRVLHTLKLCRNPFSDEAIAAFLEIAGGSLTELSLNNIKKVGHHTALSLASHSKNLHTLDLSWCRNLTDNELGLIVDSCFSLRLLKLFGCSLVTDVFLNGHSNPEIQILGLKMAPLLQNVRMPDTCEGPLRYSPVSVD